MEETISLQEIFAVLKKRMKLIIGTTIIAVILSAIVSFFLLTPIYQASTQILVNPKQNAQQNQIQSQDIQANLQLINTYNVIIKSPTILNTVIDNLDLDMTASALSSKITVTNENDSQVVNITVQDESASQAVYIANSVADAFRSEIKQLMDVDNVNILAPAELPENPTPVKPIKKLNVAIGLVIGLMIGVGLAFLLEYLDTTVKTEKDIEELLDLPILGYVSVMPEISVDIPSTSMERSRRAVRRDV